MPFDSIWLLLPVVVLLFSAWMVYEHRRVSSQGAAARAAIDTNTAAGLERYLKLLQAIERTAVVGHTHDLIAHEHDAVCPHDHHGAGHVPHMKGLTMQNVDGTFWRTEQCTVCEALEQHEVS